MRTRCRAAWRRKWTKTAVATAATAGGAATMLGLMVPSDTRISAATTSVVTRTARGTAIRGGSVWNPANSSGMAHQVALGASASRTTQTAVTDPSQVRCRVEGRPPGGGAGANSCPRAYSSPNTANRAITQPVRAPPWSRVRNRAKEEHSSRKNAACTTAANQRPSGSVRSYFGQLIAPPALLSCSPGTSQPALPCLT